MIRLSLDATNIQREKIVFEMVKPYISGFSVQPMMEVDATEEQSPAKRKSNETPSTADVESSKSKEKKNKKSKK